MPKLLKHRLTMCAVLPLLLTEGAPMQPAVSQRQLDSGRAFCFLYTDLSNPMSNHIYQKIGYQPVVDVDEIQFEG